MNFDLRFPVGLIFAIFGLILTGVGIFGGPELPKISLGINMNLYWGLAMLIFGLSFLGMALSRRNRAP